jgi:hypothetical protein
LAITRIQREHERSALKRIDRKEILQLGTLLQNKFHEVSWRTLGSEAREKPELLAPGAGSKYPGNPGPVLLNDGVDELGIEGLADVSDRNGESSHLASWGDSLSGRRVWLELEMG